MKILLVEDNEDLAENLTEIFRAEGHDVAWAPDARHGLEAAQSGFDLAIVDLRLPDGAGTAMLPRFKALAPDAEVIVSTGDADLQSAIEAVRGGAFAYLVKPVGMEELRLTIGRALERVQLRRQARVLQERLERSERRYRDIVETVQVLIVALDRDLTVHFFNRSAEEVTGYKREEVLGRNYMDLFVPPDEREWRQQRIVSAFSGGFPELEVDVLCRDGSLRRVQMRWALRVHGGETLLYGMGLDVTRQRQLEREARVSEKLAAVGTMTAGLAHEIRNPLNAAMLQLTLLQRRMSRLGPEDHKPLAAPLELVKAELARLTLLLDDFLAFARPRDFARDRVDFTALVREVATMQSHVAESMGRELDASLEDGVEVRGELNALKGVVVNLAKNALEACQDTVRLRLRKEGHNAVLTVEDDGPGIPPEVQKRLFEPFFTTKEQGTGLGLAIVYTVIAAHGGEVSIASDEKSGTAVRLLMPLRLD